MSPKINEATYIVKLLVVLVVVEIDPNGMGKCGVRSAVTSVASHSID
jgi:hypothetical protein